MAKRNSSDTPTWGSGPAAVVASESVPRKEESAEVESITLSATGDIIMGSAPNKLPANDGDGFFDSVREGLASDQPIQLTVEARAHGWRVDHYLSRVFPNFSRALFKKAIEQEAVLR